MKKLNSEIVRWIESRRFLFGGVMMVALVATGVYFWPKVDTLDEGASIAPTMMVNFNVTRPLPHQIRNDPNKVVLGEALFHDVRLSGDDTVSCASCHSLKTGGVDNRYRSVGVAGGIGGVNAPTVFNSGLNMVQFWDGRAPTLEDQVEGPVNHPKEMASNWKLIVTKLAQDAHYSQQFETIYPDGLTVENIKDAIASFERSLLTPNSRFDQFLRGDAAALTATEKTGYQLFQSYGCSSCHQGVNLGGNMYEKMGLTGDYFADRGNLTEADNGRYNLNKDPHSMHEFRVPSLRNIALTAPYFHDGYADTLEQAVAIMAKYQLGRPMPAEDVKNIVAFLHTLTGQYRGAPL